MNTPIWDYSELLEEAKDRTLEKLILEGEIKNDDGKQTGKGGGADRAIGLFQRAGNGLSSLLSVHETSSYVKIVVMSAV